MQPEPSLIQQFGISDELALSDRYLNFISGDRDLTQFFSSSGFRTSNFIPKTYGKWRNETPSRPEDFMPQNNESMSSHDFIDIRFGTAVYPVQVSIFEAVRSVGSVIKIWAKGNDFKWHRLWSGPTQILPDMPRVFSPRLQFCKYKIHRLRLELNCAHLNTRSEICGVLLLGTKELWLPYPSFRMSSINSLLDKLGLRRRNETDPYNLTPDVTSNTILNNQILKLERVLREYCISPKKLCVSNLPKELQSNSIKASSQNDHTDGAHDFFSKLPYEILLMILKHLDLRSIIRCSQVNKRLNWVTRDAVLFTSLNLKTYWNCIDGKALRYFQPRCTHLRRLEISWSGYDVGLSPVDIIDFLTSRGSLLTHLRLNSCGPAVNEAVITEISTTCKNLEELGLRGCRLQRQYVFEKLKSLQNLQRLDLDSTSIDTKSLCAIIWNNPKLRHLNLGRLESSQNMDSVAIALVNSCPQIETIDFSWSSHLSEFGIRVLAKCCHLREIDFSRRRKRNLDGWSSSRFSDAFSFLFASCTSLEKVILNGIMFRSCRYIESLLVCKRIRQLDLGDCSEPQCSRKVDMCARILSSCTELQIIDLTGFDIEDTHLKTWRNLYPNVSIISQNTGFNYQF